MDNKQMKIVLRAIREGAGCWDVDYWGSCKGGAYTYKMVIEELLFNQRPEE